LTLAALGSSQWRWLLPRHPGVADGLAIELLVVVHGAGLGITKSDKKCEPLSDCGPLVRPEGEPTPTRTSAMPSITPFLWFDNNVPEAVAFYKSVFPNAKVETVNDFMATFELEGQRFNALNGGPKYKFNEAVSFFINVETQEEVDYFWNRLIADGGEESRCGWLKDKFGLSWQVVPTALGRYLSDPDRKKADRAMQAMMKMQKIVIADLDKAFAG
jgi:predicted 3-demethylubiquinone-9 3-methyltransferase (glyoxalase superfamily)